MSDPTSTVNLFADVSDLTTKLSRIQDERARLVAMEQEVKDAKTELDALEADLIEAIRAAGMKSFTAADGSLASVSERTYYRCTQANMEQCVAWLDSHGAGEIAKRSVPWQTLESLCRDWAAEGDQLPEFIGQHTRTVLSVRKA